MGGTGDAEILRRLDELRSDVDAISDRSESGGVELHGPGGWWGRVSGQQTILILLIVAVVFGAGAFLYSHDNKMEEASKQTIASLTRSNELQEASIYMMWACLREKKDPECDTINLVRPKKILEMQVHR